MNLAETAALAHADATRRGIYPQREGLTMDDLIAEAQEAVDAWWRWSTKGMTDSQREHLGEELADTAITALSALVELGFDPEEEIARKMATNKTRGPRG